MIGPEGFSMPPQGDPEDPSTWAVVEEEGHAKEEPEDFRSEAAANDAITETVQDDKREAA